MTFLSTPEERAAEAEYFKKEEASRKKITKILETQIPHLVIKTAGGAIPFQSEGTLGTGKKKKRFYYRSRHDVVSLGIDSENPYRRNDCEHYAEIADDRFDYWDQLLNLFPELLQNLSPKLS